MFFLDAYKLAFKHKMAHLPMESFNGIFQGCGYVEQCYIRGKDRNEL